MSRTRRNLYIEDSIWNAIQKLADQDSRSASNLIEVILKDYINNHSKRKKKDGV